MRNMAKRRRVTLVYGAKDTLHNNAVAIMEYLTVELSQVQKTELHRRVAAHRADPSTAVPWEQVRSKLFPSKP